MIGDPVASLQPSISEILVELSETSEVEIGGQVEVDVAWRPHILERAPLRGWYFHFQEPESDSWADRIRRAQVAKPGLRAGVAAPAALLDDGAFIDKCDELECSIVTIKERRDSWVAEKFYNSVPDFICEERIRLPAILVRRLLDRWLERATTESNDQRKGVLLEVVVALLLSQVDGFEVSQIGISNRSQQMDVMVHNRNQSGALSQSPIVLAEAKNWPKNPVGPDQYASFLRKLEARHGRAKLGYLVTTGRFTRGVGSERRRESKGDTLVVFVDGKQLPTLWRSGNVTAAVERATINATVGV